MRANLYNRVILTLIAIFLAVIAINPLLRPVAVVAQSGNSYLYIEPGVNSLRKPDGTARLDGKVVIDLRNGNIWGFPTLSGAPYPVDVSRSEPPVSAPMYLGKFDFSKMTP